MRRTLISLLAVSVIIAVAGVGLGSSLKTKPERPVPSEHLAPSQSQRDAANPNPQLQEYQQWVQELLAPALVPLAQERVRVQRGPATVIKLAAIRVLPHGRVLVYMETAKGLEFIRYKLVYEWQDGWQLIEEDHDV